MDTSCGNSLLCTLDEAEWLRWQPELEMVDLALGRVLHESGQAQRYVYFPSSAIVALLYTMENGDTAEIGVVGNEGLIGFSLMLGSASTPSRAVVQCAGSGYRVRASWFKEEVSRPAMQHVFMRFTLALIIQMMQTAVCNRHHRLDQQLCRWLLLSLDRLEGHELRMTQELISEMLGVRRVSVSEAAMKLQLAGLLRYSRGKIEVLDRAGLEKRTCECYAVVKKEYDRLLPQQNHVCKTDRIAHRFSS